MLYNSHNWQVIGHDWAVQQLTCALNAGRQRHAYLISGPPAIGKTTFARSLAMALNCTAENNRPCGECRACKLIGMNKHADLNVLEAERVGGTLKIDQIRELQHTLSMRPYEARYRVAIIRRFQEAHPAASNALLKTLEEPPKNVVLMLTTDSVHMLLPTILSRCQHFPLHPLRLTEVALALQSQWGVEKEKAELLAHLSGGRIGWAINALNQPELLEARQDHLQLLETLLTSKRRERFAAVEEFHDKKSDLLELLQAWQTYWRDALILGQGSQAWITNIDRLNHLRLLANQQPPEKIQKALTATRQTLDYLGRNVNSRLAVEALLLDYPLLKGTNS